MAFGKFDFRLLTVFATRSSLISSMKSLKLSLSTAMHQDSRKKTAIENISSHKACDIIKAGLSEIRVKSVAVGWSQCIETTGKRFQTLLKPF